jgi:hypothetical protein
VGREVRATGTCRRVKKSGDRCNAKPQGYVTIDRTGEVVKLCRDCARYFRSAGSVTIAPTISGDPERVIERDDTREFGGANGGV